MIIKSLLDTDLYKFTMQQTVLHHFPSAMVEYHFRCRTPGVDLVQHLDRINHEVDELCTLGFTKDELDYLRSLRYIRGDYVEFLKTFRLSRDYVSIVPVADRPGEIDVVIVGPWFYTILFEIPILAIINQVYFEASDTPEVREQGRERLQAKIALIRAYGRKETLRFSDFGTRRRFAYDWHREVVDTLRTALPQQFTGTSNVLFAKDMNLVPIGTMAHEYLQACQTLGPSLPLFQRFAYDTWAQEFRGDLGIALTDVINMDAFLRDFDLYFCKLFDGARHDSGDPYRWGDRLIAHYEKNRVDPRTKNLVFSDGLNVQKMLDLHTYFEGRAKTSYGIGTTVTNDLGPTALQIVLKMTRCNGRPVAKLSDSEGKTMCDDPLYLGYLRSAFDNPNDVLVTSQA